MKWIAALGIALAAGRAAADPPSELVSRPLVLAPGAVEGALAIEIGLDAGSAGQPVSLAPDLWYGVDDRLTVGVVHSAGALARVGAGDGLCVGGAAHGCEQAYSNLGVDARWSIARGEWSAAAHVVLVTRRWSPWLPAARLGALARWQRGRVAITIDPYAQIGLDHVDQGNRNQLQLPVWIAVQPGCRWELYLHTGVGGDVAVMSDAWAVPAALGAKVALTPRLELAAEAGFVRALGPLNDGKLRAAWIAVDARWP